MNTPTIAWHYTIGKYFQSILKTGAILPIPTNGAPKRERSVVWLSTELFWEPTACKGYRKPDGTVGNLDMMETEKRGGGLFRFGVPVDSSYLFTFDDFVDMSGISQRDAERLERVGIRQGAEPERWLVSFDPIPTIECLIEGFDCGGWMPVQKSGGEVVQ